MDEPWLAIQNKIIIQRALDFDDPVNMEFANIGSQAFFGVPIIDMVPLYVEIDSSIRKDVWALLIHIGLLTNHLANLEDQEKPKIGFNTGE